MGQSARRVWSSSILFFLQVAMLPFWLDIHSQFDKNLLIHDTSPALNEHTASGTWVLFLQVFVLFILKHGTIGPRVAWLIRRLWIFHIFPLHILWWSFFSKCLRNVSLSPKPLLSPDLYIGVSAHLSSSAGKDSDSLDTAPFGKLCSLSSSPESELHQRSSISAIIFCVFVASHQLPLSQKSHGLLSSSGFSPVLQSRPSQ